MKLDAINKNKVPHQRCHKAKFVYKMKIFIAYSSLFDIKMLRRYTEYKYKELCNIDT